MTRQSLTKADIVAVLALRSNGMSPSSIGKYLGIPAAAVHRVMRQGTVNSPVPLPASILKDCREHEEQA